MSQLFPNLFSSFELKGLEIKNRIFSTGHDTDLARQGLPTEELTAYHVERAKGGAGLIIIQVVAVHPSAMYTSQVLQGWHTDLIPSFKHMVDKIKSYGTRVFVQLFHPGRELASRQDGIISTAWGVSTLGSERFRVVPKAMSTEEVEEVIESYVKTGTRLVEAGVDGLEIVASHGYLPAQFLSPIINNRNDRYGGCYENRLRFVRDISKKLKRAVSSDLIVGARFSGNEFDHSGASEEDMFSICRDLSSSLDYTNLIGGTSATSGGAVHIAPPMTIQNAYLSPVAQKLKQAIPRMPIFLAGRINQPHEAEAVLTSGSADMCGMTRAMISDPMMPVKAQRDQPDDIRACVACNQACIGHAQVGVPISCIQFPESGRELKYSEKKRAVRGQRVLVIGGGPAGMKAAAVAAECGHNTTLIETGEQLGGQILMAQRLPKREEFGGIVTNLERELRNQNVEVVYNKTVNKDYLIENFFDYTILASGSKLKLPHFNRDGSLQTLSYEDVLLGKPVGNNIVIYDWRSDWIGIGVAEKLAAAGCYVRLAVNGLSPGSAIQSYVREDALARLYSARVEIITFSRLFGVDDENVYLSHTVSQQPIILENVDTVIIIPAMEPLTELMYDLKTLKYNYAVIGDAASPRTVEEAVYEGLKSAVSIR